MEVAAFICKSSLSLCAFAVMLLLPPIAATSSVDPVMPLLLVGDDNRYEECSQVMEYQELHYWTDRRCVSIKLKVSNNHRVEQTVAVVNLGTSRDADSLRALAESWRIPDEFPIPLNKCLSAAFALDHAGNDPAQVRTLPSSVIEAMDREPLRLWLDAIRLAGIRVSPDSFRGYLPCKWRRFPSAESKVFKAALASDRAFLRESPGGSYVMFVQSMAWGGSRSDHATMTVYDGDTKKLSHIWGSSAAAIHVFQWMDDVTFVLGGVSAIRHPVQPSDTVLDAVVPTLWVGNPDKGWIHRYVGLPITIVEVPELRRHLVALLSTVYPEGSWDEVEVYPRYSFQH